MAKRIPKKPRSAPSSREPGADRPEFVPGYVWDAEAAAKPAEFVEQLVRVPSSTGEPQPVQLIPWQRERVIAPLFGWKRADGRLRYRRGAVFVPKKNGKTWLMSGLAQYLLTAHQPLADVYPAAVDREQARILYRMLKRSVESSPLSKVLEVVDSKSIIRNRKHGNILRCLSADAWRNEGLNGSVIIDEIHAHRTDELVSALTYATRATPNGLVLAISTAGDDRKGPGWQWWQDCELVTKNPAANPTFFGLIYAADPDNDDMDSPETWRKANPSMGVTFPEEEFRADWQDSLTSSVKRSRWLRYSMNVWSSPDNRWFTPEQYAPCVVPPPQPLDGRSCFIGLDLADHLDLTAAVALFPDGAGGWDADAMFWMPEDNVFEREKETRVPLRQWIADGWIRTTPGARLDHDQVAADLIEYSKTHRVRSVGADPWNLGSVATQLHRHGLEVQAVGQTAGRMSAPSKLLEALIHEKLFRCPSPVMQWMAQNVCVYSDHIGNVKPDKGKSTEKIDGIVAAVCGLAVSLTSEPETSADAWQIVEL